MSIDLKQTTIAFLMYKLYDGYVLLNHVIRLVRGGTKVAGISVEHFD